MKTLLRTTGAALLVAGTLLCVSCGTKANIAAEVTAVDPTTSVAPGPTDSAPAPPSTGSAATPAPPDSAAPPAPDSPDRNDQAFCAAAGKVVNSGLQNTSLLDPGVSSDPQQAMAKFKEWMGTVDAIMTEMDNTAPAPIATDMHTVAEATHKSVAALQSATDLSQMLGSNAIMGGPDSVGTSDRVARYVLDHCGFSLQGRATG